MKRIRRKARGIEKVYEFKANLAEIMEKCNGYDWKAEGDLPLFLSIFLAPMNCNSKNGYHTGSA